jgi:hypothetical protein
MTIALVSLLAAAIGCSDAVSPDDALTAKALGLTEVTAVEGSGEAMLLANFSNPSLCLTAGRSGDQAIIASCDDESAAQVLTWEADGAISTGGGLCLEASGARNGDPVTFSGCTGASAQVWSASSDEHIVSASGACLDLERRGGGGNSTVVWNCGGRDSQGWGARGSDQSTDEPADDPTDDPTDDPVALAAGVEGVWISAEEISQLPTSGAAWDALLRDAERDPGVADVSDQNSNHDVYTLAAALVCVRTGQHCAKARDGVVSAIGTEQDGRWLAVGRNLTAYVIAADLLGLRNDGNASSAGSQVEKWIRSFLTMELDHNNSGEPYPFVPFGSGSNASAQEGAAYAAVGAYLGDQDALDRVWDAFRTYACDPGAPDREDINLSQGVRYGWAHDDDRPCAVNPRGTTKQVPSGLAGAGGVYRIDGAIINDMRRGGEYQWEPGYTRYPWVGLEGFVPAALILHRAGYPAFEVADRAVLRTHEYLWYLRTETGNSDWFDGKRASEVVHLVNVAYGTDYLVQGTTGGGRLVGYTDWTHQQSID